MKNTDTNITNNIKNDVPVAGTDFFADSENFLNELTDSELVQVRGGAEANVKGKAGGAKVDVAYDDEFFSGLSLLLCN